MVAQIALVLVLVIFISVNQTDNNSTMDCPSGLQYDLPDRQWCHGMLNGITGESDVCCKSYAMLSLTVSIAIL